MNKIALFGGAFDPLTRAHTSCAKELLKYGFSKVWFVPCNISASSKVLSPGIDRINMCNIGISGMQNIETCDVEIKHNLQGTSYEILLFILNKYKDRQTQFYFAMGMDNANSVYSWPNYQKSLDLIPFVILPREDLSKQNPSIDWYKKPPHMFLESLPTFCISSTKFKQEYSSTGSSNLVDKNVLEYIKKHGLYKNV